MFNNANNTSIIGSNLVNIGNLHSYSRSDNNGIDLLHKHIAPGALHNSSERYDRPKCHPRTRLAVIQAIMDWIEDGQRTSFIMSHQQNRLVTTLQYRPLHGQPRLSQICGDINSAAMQCRDKPHLLMMWLYGPAGSGKSSIAQTIAEMLHQSESRRLAASFFWSRTAPGRNSEERLITTLAFQLVLALPEIRVYVEHALERDPSLFSRSLEAQMQGLILEPLEKAFNPTNRVDPFYAGTSKLIILDGLDECGTPDSQRYILKVIAIFVRKFPIPIIFLIASRSELAIRESFNTELLSSFTTRLALDDTYHPDHDIRLFLVESFESLKTTHAVRSLLPLDWPSTKEVDQLIRKSSGQFIYAATVVKFVSSPRHRPHDRLDIILGISASGTDTPFAELDALYRHILGSVIDFPRALDILSCLILDYLINTTNHVEAILSYRFGEVQLILIDLHSVIEVPDNGIDELRILHASLPDFLMDPARSGEFLIHEGNAHAHIAQLYLQYIRGHLNSEDCDDSLGIMRYVIFNNLADHCVRASVTRDLLAGCFDFDFITWVKWLLEDIRQHASPFDRKHEEYGNIFVQVYLLYRWICTQDENVQTHFGSGKSLSGHHSRSREVALGLVFEEILKSDDDDVVAGVMHPRFADQGRISSLDPFDFFGVRNTLTEVVTYIDCQATKGLTNHLVIELQNYLRDPQRSGLYFVNGGKYAAFAVRFIKCNLDTYCGDVEGGPDCDKEDPDIVMCLLGLGLPFYLSNSDFTPNLERELFRLSKYLLAHNFSEVWEDKEEELQRAIDLYLQKKTRISAEESGQPSQDLNPEEVQAAQILMQLAQSARGVS